MTKIKNIEFAVRLKRFHSNVSSDSGFIDRMVLIILFFMTPFFFVEVIRPVVISDRHASFEVTKELRKGRTLNDTEVESVTIYGNVLHFPRRIDYGAYTSGAYFKIPSSVCLPLSYLVERDIWEKHCD